MPTESTANGVDDFPLVLAGPSHRLSQYLGLSGTGPARSLWRIGLLVLATWGPLLAFSWISGYAVGRDVAVPFFHDPEVHVRFLVVLPLLEIASILVAMSLPVQAQHFSEARIVSEQDMPGFRRAQSDALWLRQAIGAEGAILVLCYVVSVVLRLVFHFSEGDSSWELTGGVVTLAGWWYMLFSLPILYFLLLRWAWVFALWGWLLFRISRLDLKLTATHPDRAGGLGFIAWGLVSFAPVLAAIAAVCSAALADEVLHRGKSLDSLKYDIAAFAISAIAVLYLPLLTFSGKLSRCRFKGLLDFGALALRYDRAFDEKWISDPAAVEGRALLGNSDLQSLAAVATCYEHSDRMRLIPFDSKAFFVLVLAALVPMIPLLGTAVPLREMFVKLASLLM